MSIFQLFLHNVLRRCPQIRPLQLNKSNCFQIFLCLNRRFGTVLPLLVVGHVPTFIVLFNMRSRQPARRVWRQSAFTIRSPVASPLIELDTTGVCLAVNHGPFEICTSFKHAIIEFAPSRAIWPPSLAYTQRPDSLWMARLCRS